MMKEGSQRGQVGTEKKLGKQKEVEEDDEVVVVRMKWRRTESESEWRREEGGGIKVIWDGCSDEGGI